MAPPESLFLSLDSAEIRLDGSGRRDGSDRGCSVLIRLHHATIELTNFPSPNNRADSWANINNLIDYTVRHQSTMVRYHGKSREFRVVEC